MGTLEKMDEGFIKQRNEKGNAEIKKMAEHHFKEREADEAKVKELEERIAKNKQEREASKAARAAQAAEMNRKLEEQKAAAEAAEAARQVAEKEKQVEVMQAMSAGYDKDAASKRRGPQKKMRRRVDALNTARPKEIVAE